MLLKIAIINIFLAMIFFITPKILIENRVKNKFPEVYAKFEFQTKHGFKGISKFYYQYIYSIKDEEDRVMKKLKILNIISIVYAPFSFICCVIIGIYVQAI